MDAAEMLARTTLFDDLSPEDVADLAQHLRRQRFSAGALICRKGWILLNGVTISRMMFAKEPFDPFPFIFFNLLLSIVAAFQGPVIMMSQNRQSLKDRAQAETDFKVNIKNEVGIETLVRGLAEVKAHLAMLEKGVSAGRPAREGPRPGPGNGGPA